MKIEWRLFAGAAGFYVLTAAAYWFITYEDAGTTMLAASVPAFAFVGIWLWFENRHNGPRPEDRPEGSPSDPDAGGDVGYYPSSSPWPFVLAAGVVVLANGLVFGASIAALGVLLMVAGIVGYAREADCKV